MSGQLKSPGAASARTCPQYHAACNQSGSHPINESGGLVPFARLLQAFGARYGKGATASSIKSLASGDGASRSLLA